MKYVPTHTTLHFQINILSQNWFITLAAISHVEKLKLNIQRSLVLMLNAGYIEGRRYSQIDMNWQHS